MRKLALPIAGLLACSGSEDPTTAGSTSVAPAIREQPAPQCHDVVASTRMPEMVIAASAPATGGNLPNDGRYELAKVTGSKELFDALGRPSPQVYEIRGAKLFFVLGPPEQSLTRGTSEIKTNGGKPVPAGTGLELEAACGNDAASRQPYSETQTGFRLGDLEFVRVD